MGPPSHGDENKMAGFARRKAKSTHMNDIRIDQITATPYYHRKQQQADNKAVLTKGVDIDLDRQDTSRR